MYREKTDQFIEEHKEQMLEDICKLCSINSEKAQEKPGMPYGEGNRRALDAAMAMAESYGFSTRNYDNRVGTADLNDLPAQLDILAHLDVVPAGEGWTVTEPYAPLVKDGRIYGRGTADDKGPAVAALYAMRAVKEMGIPLKKNVRLILGTDEECGSSDIEYYYAVEQEAPMTFSPDAEYPVINVEKGRLEGHFTAEFEASRALPRLVSIQAGTKSNVVPGKAHAVVEGISQEELERAVKTVREKTGISFDIMEKKGCMHITAVGAGAHASTPQEGQNALTGILELILALPLAPCRQLELLGSLQALIPHGDTQGQALGIAMSDEISGALTLALSLLKVDGSAIDGVFDSRCPVCANEDNVLHVVKQKMAHSGITLHNDSMRPPHHVDGDSLFVKTLLKVYEDYTGQKGHCEYTGGGTYVHDLKSGVAFGAAMPGTDNRMHGADEFAVVDELVISAKMFAQVITELCG